jgi:hypothetical protein
LIQDASTPLKILNENEKKSIVSFNSNKDKYRNSYNNYDNSYMNNTYKNNAFNFNNNNDYNMNQINNLSSNSNLTSISKTTKKENGIRIKTHKERMKENSSNENLLLKNIEDEKIEKKNENEKTNFSNEIKNEDKNINMNIAGYYDNIRNNRSHVSTQNPDTGAGSRAQNPDTGAGSRAQNPDTGAGSRGKDPLTGYWDQYTGNQEFWEDDDGPPGDECL